MSRNYRLAGLNVRSDEPLSGAAPARAADVDDLEIVCGPDRHVPSVPPEGEELGLLHVEGVLRHAVVRLPSGEVVFRVPGIVDFAITPDLRRVTQQRDPRADPSLAAVLTSGALLAVVLELRGELVLHASAVAFAERTVALSGHAGSGKTTIAGLLCAAGATLVADDLLRVDLTEPSARVWPGGNELRLRQKAADVTALLDIERHETGDGRIGLIPEGVFAGTPRELHLIALPHLHRDARRPVELVPLTSTDAMVRLLTAPRLLGWSHPELHRRRFEKLGTLLARVPTAVLHLPWGVTFSSAFAERVAEQLGRE
jgi:hypothetical protein